MDAANENLNLLNITEQVRKTNAEQPENDVQEVQAGEENIATVQEENYAGQGVEQEAIQEGTPENVQETVGENIVVQAEKKKKVRTHASFAKNIVSITLFLLSLVFGITASTLYVVREALSREYVNQAVYDMTLGDIGIGFWYGYSGQEVTLDEYMTDVLNSSGVVNVQQKDVKRLLECEFVKTFTADRFNRYVSDFIYGTGEGTISVQEIIQLFDDNWSETARILGIDTLKHDGVSQEDIKKDILDGAYEKLVQDIHFGSFTLSNFRKEYPVVINAAHTMVSYPAIAAMVALAVLFWIIILFMNIRYCGGFRYIGRCMSLIGIVNLAAAGAMYVLPVVLNRLFGLGYGFYIAFFNLQVRKLLYAGAVILGCGILITLMGKILRKIRKRILRRKLT